MAVVATPAGAANYRELGSVAADLSQEPLGLLCARRDLAHGRFDAPSAGTLRRVLIELDASELDAAVGAWLREHALCDQAGWAIALDGKDLNGSWDSSGRLVLFSAMTHRAPGQDAVVIGQIAVADGTTETTQVRALLENMDITGALVTPMRPTRVRPPPATWSKTRTPTACSPSRATARPRTPRPSPRAGY